MLNAAVQEPSGTLVKRYEVPAKDADLAGIFELLTANQAGLVRAPDLKHRRRALRFQAVAVVFVIACAGGGVVAAVGRRIVQSLSVKPPDSALHLHVICHVRGWSTSP